MSLWNQLKTRLFVGDNVSIGARFHLGLLSYVSASRRLTIGHDVYIGKFCSIQCNGSIGNGCLIANNVGIVGRRDHDFREVGQYVRRARWVGGAPELADDLRNAVTIEDDVWIGFGAVILSGITIGRGAVIAAGATVTADVSPYDVVSGNPATPSGRRFSPEQIQRHEALLAKRAR